MGNVVEKDVIVDVGAFVGLYTIALAKRVGPQGVVVAFEPDPGNFAWLQRHVALNHVEGVVTLRNVAVGGAVETRRFSTGHDAVSHLDEARGAAAGVQVPVSTLDQEFPHRRLDLLKIDVEGAEELVLRGGVRLLQDPARAPRSIYIEVHPYAWGPLGTSDRSLLDFLAHCRYRVSTVEGHPVDRLDRYGEIVASKITG